MNNQKYKKIFLTEADEKILELNTALLALEKKPNDTSSASAAMSAAHTLKSSAAAMEYMSISHLAHAMEDLFEGVRLEKKSIQPEAVELLFEAIDTLSFSVKNLKKNQEELNSVALISQLKEVKERAFKDQGKKVGSAEAVKAIITSGNGVNNIDKIETIKVDVEVLDRLMNLTEELLVEKMQLSEIVRNLERASQNKEESLEPKVRTKESDIKKLPELKKSLENFNRLLANLQYNVTESRMVPLGQILDRFPRMVRDLAKEQNKKVDLEIKGGDIELDRSVIDSLGEPLVHLLKNSIDHGISEKGTISLSAERARDKVIVSIEDNGEGINWRSVVEAAVKKGIIGEAKGRMLLQKHADNYADKRGEYQRDSASPSVLIRGELEELIFHPELSTSDHVTETSGRGIGLHIVKSAIEALGGAVRVESPVRTISNIKSQNANLKSEIRNLKLEGGTIFRLELPLTLAIIQALLVKVSNQIFALPFSQIDRSVRVPEKNIKKVFDREVAVIDNEDVSMIRLDQRFDFDKERKSLFYSEEELHEIKHVLGAELIVISKAGGRQIGIVIDELISEQDIVVKPLKGVMKQPKGFAGITLLGDGKPALILDLATLL
jgi:two-component system, chemotaxis family, sensor kinase CheA